MRRALATPTAAAEDTIGAIPPSRTPTPTLPDPSCTQSYANDAPARGAALRFGIGPRFAGINGDVQATPTVMEKARKRDAALVGLSGGRYLAVRPALASNPFLSPTRRLLSEARVRHVPRPDRAGWGRGDRDAADVTRLRRQVAALAC